MNNHWPQLDYLGWRETCSALHLYLMTSAAFETAAMLRAIELLGSEVAPVMRANNANA